MRFIIPINDAEIGESVTCHVLESGSDVARTNKRILKQYLEAMGVDEKQHKYVLKKLGFWGEALGR